MLFDLALGGHHGNYIQHLIDRWCEQNSSGSLDIVVLPQFLQIHSDVVETIAKRKHPNIKLVPISQAQTKALNSRKSSLARFWRNFQEWRLFCQYATALKATYGLLMYFDTCELPLAMGMPSPCPFSGIYFRPTFHYGTFTNYAPSRKDKLQQVRERIALSRILRHPQLKTLYCLDPFAVKYIELFRPKASVVHLQDPVQISQASQSHVEEIRTQLGIEPDRKVLLLFGALDGRKGIYQLLDALSLLESNCQEICLLLVGGTHPIEQERIKNKVETIRRTLPIHIVSHCNFVPESDVTAYFQLADLVLAPYQRHVGMSGILLLAAAAGKPVLSSDYGLMGELVRRYSLGLTIDSMIPQEIAKGIDRCLQSPENLCDRDLMKSFAEQNSAEQYVKTIFQYL
jgi:glycosyltransferase involved in cell wall biosynthesis